MIVSETLENNLIQLEQEEHEITQETHTWK